MLILDTATASNTLIVTLKEKSVGTSPVYRLELFNFYTNETFFYSNLQPIQSNDRKDVFQLSFSQEFIGRTCSVGQYKYTFYQTGLTGATSISVVETGMAHVINSATHSEFLYIEPTETDDDYITY